MVSKKDTKLIKVDLQLEEGRAWLVKQIISSGPCERKNEQTKFIKYTELKLQNIYKSENINSYQAKNLYRWRTRTWDFRTNYRSKYPDLKCQLCLSHIDKDDLFLSCQVIINEVPSVRLNQTLKYDDLFSDDVEKQEKIGKLLDVAYKKRVELLSKLAINN